MESTMREIKSISLETDHLELIPATLEMINAEIEAPENLASLLNAQVEPGWPPGEYDRAAQDFFRDRLIEGGSAIIGWYGWYALKRRSLQQMAILVGAGGYFGPPDEDNGVEIGFSIMPAWQGFGYATELAEALVKHAFSYNRVQKVIAHTSPENVASRRVLKKCKFRLVCRESELGNDLFEISRIDFERTGGLLTPIPRS